MTTEYTTIYTHCGKAFTALSSDIEYLVWHQVWKMHKITSHGTEQCFLRKIYVKDVIKHDERFQ